jgi:hypothetical protein
VRTQFEYLGDYIKAALKGAGGLMVTVLSILGLIVGIALIPILAVALGFEARSVVLAFTVMVALLLLTHYGPFRAYQAARRRVAGLENMFDVLETDRAKEHALLPQILWQKHEVKKIPIRNVPSGLAVAEPYFARIYLTNRPLQPSREVAEKVVAHITFKNRKGNAVIPTMIGRWADNPEVAQVGNLRQIKTIDIEPNGLPVCLDVAVKYEEDADCFAYNDDSVVRDAFWRDPEKRLPPGKYLVEIELLGLGVKQNVKAILENRGIGEAPELRFADQGFTQY